MPLVGVLQIRGGWDGGEGADGTSSDTDRRRSPTPPGGWEYDEEEGEGGVERVQGKCGEEEEEETTAQRLGINDEDGRQWGPGDRYRDGVEVGPDDLDEETAKPRVTDRGTLGGGSMHSIKQFVSSVGACCPIQTSRLHKGRTRTISLHSFLSSCTHVPPSSKAHTHDTKHTAQKTRHPFNSTVSTLPR